MSERAEAANKYRLADERLKLVEGVQVCADALDIIANSGCDQAVNVRNVSKALRRLISEGSPENGSSTP